MSKKNNVVEEAEAKREYIGPVCLYKGKVAVYCNSQDELDVAIEDGCTEAPAADEPKTKKAADKK